MALCHNRQRERATASEPPERSEAAKRRASDGAGESEGRSPSARMTNEMRYAQYAPSPALAPVVEWYWILEGPGCDDAQPIVPDGRVEIVLHFGDRFERHHAGGFVERQDAALLVGQILAPIRLACRGRAGVAAIRLRPAAARALAGCPAAELTGRTVDLEAIAGSTATLRDRLACAADDAARVRLLEAWLAPRIRIAPSRDVVAAVGAIL